jgi:hypothetical protein
MNLQCLEETKFSCSSFDNILGEIPASFAKFLALIFPSLEMEISIRNWNFIIGIPGKLVAVEKAGSIAFGYLA